MPAAMLAPVIAAAPALDDKLQIVTIVGSAALLVIVFELVRRRRLMERYSLLWLFAALVLLLLAVFSELLSSFADAVGIQTPSNALFFVMLGFVILMLLHFSASISKLNDEVKILAQRLAATEERLRRVEGDGAVARRRDTTAQVEAGEHRSQPSGEQASGADTP